METVTIIGIDIAKNVFHLHGATADGEVVFRRKLTRGKLLDFVRKQPLCLVVMEACGGAHHWGREITQMGHDVRLISPHYVKPFVKRQKNDANDAEAIVEAASRKTMRFVAVKSAEQQGQAMVLKTRDLLQMQRTQAINALRGHLARQGYIARGGQILDASIVPVPRNHNTREENAAIKEGKEPEGWKDKPAKRCQKDTDARWTKKHGKSHYGYKNHVNVDRKHKLIRRYHVSDAALHDSQAVDELLMQGNTASGVWADAAYRSEEIEAKLRARGFTSRIHRKGKRSKPLTEQAKKSNRTKSSVRVRVEHVFGAQTV